MIRVKKHTPEDYIGEFNLLLMEKNLILRVYRISRGSKQITAKILGITPRSLYDKIDAHELKKEMENIIIKIKNRNNVDIKTN